MKYLREVCAIPTAPFLEGRVVEYVRRFVARHRALRMSADRHGNLLIVLPGQQGSRGRWVFVAHMDHPGMHARRMIGRNVVEAEFRGYVLAEYLAGAPVRFFDGKREIAGRVLRVTAVESNGRASLLLAKVRDEVPPASLGMLDFPEACERNGLFMSRACDDLAGVATCLAMLDRLCADPPRATIAVLLTRAEEGGLVGAMAAAVRPSLLRRTDRIISLEASSVQPYAPLGGGPIIRVGDRLSIFNSALTCFLTEQAEALKTRRHGFRYQRALMPGGVCEATVFDAYGFQAAAMCLALGNYHNMDTTHRRAGAEYVNAADWRHLVDLCEAVARNAHAYTGNHRNLRRQLESRYNRLKENLTLYPIPLPAGACRRRV